MHILEFFYWIGRVLINEAIIWTKNTILKYKRNILKIPFRLQLGDTTIMHLKWIKVK